jgi:hypothetical protein
MHNFLSQFSLKHFLIVLESHDLQETKEVFFGHWLQNKLQFLQIIFLQMLQNKEHLKHMNLF